MSVLYIVATPIGNLEDISRRAIRILSGVDLILCEDTRITKKLLGHYGIETPVLSYHQHSKIKKINYILEILKQGKDVALVSDAGSPGISDPGGKLIKAIVENSSTSPGLVLKIRPVPGPCAAIAAASVSGFFMDRFLFLGFPPTKRKRKKFFEQMVQSEYPIIFYESPYRIIKTLEEIGSLTRGREIVVCRELTKKFETVYRGRINEVIEKLKNPPAGERVKGEFVVIVNKS